MEVAVRIMKFFLIGDLNVGKTSILYSYIDDNF